jgi:CBS domain containing-hemolysin-like protein
MGTAGLLVLCGVGVAAAASFFFALSESSLFALGTWKARQLADASPVRGRIVLRLLERPAELLATIVLGNTVANASIVALGLWPALEEHWSIAGAVIVSLFLVLVVCEVLPKTLAVRSPEKWALRIAPLMLAIRSSTGWFQRLAEGFNNWILRVIVPRTTRPQTAVSEEEYHELIEMAFQQGTIAEAEKDIILEIISLDRKTARDVMRPLSRMDAVSDELSIEEMITAARRFKHRRLPVYDESPDNIVGILNTQALLLDPNVDLADVIDFASFVPASMNLLQLLKSFERQERGLAVVLDEFGGTAGLITIQDILEQVVGQIPGESQDVQLVMEKLGDGKWRVSGTIRIDDFRREYPPLGEVPEVDTIGGLLIQQSEVVPATGQSVTFRGLRLTAAKVEERCVREVVIERLKRK